MIDVLKRLAELDAKNPNVVKESKQVAECGMMPEMGLPTSAPSHPASINMTAGSGEELGDLLTTIMSLAGVAGKGGAGDAMPLDVNEPGQSTAPAGILEPAGGEQDATSAMRSVIDKLNPADGESPEGSDDVSKAHGDLDNDGDHDMDDHDMEKKEPVDEYDNTPSDPTDKNEFDADQFAHQENQPGQGDRMDGDRPKAYADMNEAVSDLFAQYRRFVNEN